MNLNICHSLTQIECGKSLVPKFVEDVNRIFCVCLGLLGFNVNEANDKKERENHEPHVNVTRKLIFFFLFIVFISCGSLPTTTKFDFLPTLPEFK